MVSRVEFVVGMLEVYGLIILILGLRKMQKMQNPKPSPGKRKRPLERIGPADPVTEILFWERADDLGELEASAEDS